MPKIVPPLTANGIDKIYRLKVERVLTDGMTPGLELRFRKNRASWSLVATGPAGRKRVTLGSYPDVTLARARQLAAEARERIQSVTTESVSTLGAMVERYAGVEGVRLRTWDDQQRVMRWVFATLWATPCHALTVASIQRVVDAHAARVMAARALGYLRPVLSWGRRRGYVALVESDLETPRGVNRRRGRVLTREEIVRVVGHLREHTREPHYRAMLLMLLTACRRDEVADMTWGEITLGSEPYWRIPAERIKPGVDIVVPLVPQALEALGEPGEGRVFPVLHNWSRWQKRIYEATETSGWHRHDLRRTTATIAGELGYAPHVVDVMLGHTHLGSGTHTNYNLSRYRPEHREALQAVAHYYWRLTD